MEIGSSLDLFDFICWNIRPRVLRFLAKLLILVVQCDVLNAILFLSNQLHILMRLHLYYN
jgi:hypothetical protein